MGDPPSLSELSFDRTQMPDDEDELTRYVHRHTQKFLSATSSHGLKVAIDSGLFRRMARGQFKLSLVRRAAGVETDEDDDVDALTSRANLCLLATFNVIEKCGLRTARRLGLLRLVNQTEERLAELQGYDRRTGGPE